MIESKAFLKSTNVITAGKLLALICSIILLSVKISAVVYLPGLNPFRGGSRGRVQGVRTPPWDDLQPLSN